tara:strand:- start:574 stop:825 length:252 start_codon:yes stop_codon:yes gene_type:complete
MPRYEYQCESCGGEYYIAHSYREKVVDCIQDNCDGKISKIMSKITIRKNKVPFNKVGSVVDQSIEDSKDSLKREKENLRKKRK